MGNGAERVEELPARLQIRRDFMFWQAWRLAAVRTVTAIHHVGHGGHGGHGPNAWGWGWGWGCQMASSAALIRQSFVVSP